MLLQKRFPSFTDPWRQLADLQRELSRTGLWGTPAEAKETPLVNIYSNDDRLMVTAEVPGLSADKFDVTVTGDTVTISGERAAESLTEGQSLHRMERPTGRFSRTIQLPYNVDPSRTEASYDRGVLKLSFGRPEEQRPKKVTVKPV